MHGPERPGRDDLALGSSYGRLANRFRRRHVRAAGRGDVVATDQDRIVICTLCRQGFAAVVRTRAPATVRTQGEGAHPEFLSAVRI